MMLEENAKKSLAMDTYKQAASLFEKRLKEKPTEADLMNYVFVLFLRITRIILWMKSKRSISKSSVQQ